MADRQPLLAAEDGEEGRVKPTVSACKLHDNCFLSGGAQASGAETYSKVQRKLVIACVLCFIFMIIEVVGGYIARSVAIMSDAAHMLSDVSAFLVSIFAAWAATQPSSWHYSFGYHRAEILGALVSVLTIWAVTGALVFEAVQRTIHPVRVDGKLMFIVSVAGVCFNVMIALTLGVHAHLGAGHDHGHGHGHSHGHGHGHSHGGTKQQHSHGSANGKQHAHAHGHSHGQANGSHAHEHGDVSSYSHSHSSHSHSSHSSSCSSHEHEQEAPPPAAAGAAARQQQTSAWVAAAAAAGGTQQAPAGAAGARAPGSVVIDLPPGAAAPLGSSGAARCTISKLNDSEIEVHCELPAPARAHGTHAHGHGHSHDHGHGHDHGSINLRSAVLHVIGDILQSIGVAVAGALIWWNQDDPRWYLADPICTFVFSIVVLLTTKSILRDIVHVLMERTPLHMDVPTVSQGMAGMEGIHDVHDLHIWNISTSTSPVLTAHVHIGPDADANAMLQKLEAYVRGIGIDHSTIQICNVPRGDSSSASRGDSSQA